MKRLVAKVMVLIAVMVMAVPASADDAQIAKQIIAKLNQQKQAANLKGFDLGVQVDDGTVTMMGQVASADQAMLALDVARRIPGVRLVVNDLYVKQVKVAQPDLTLAQAKSPRQQTGGQQPVVAPPVAQAAAEAAAVPAAQPTATPEPTQPAAQPTQPAAQPTQLAAQPRQPAPQPIAQTAARSIAQPLPARPAMPHYASTGAVGSAIAYPQAQRPVPFAQSTIRQTSAHGPIATANYVSGGYPGEMVVGGGYAAGAVADNPSMPGHAWPSYAASPNYGAVAYPQQYSATAWPYIGPFYPYPQVPLGWRKVSLEWDDGWWFLDFTKK